jgi:GAF domain-containing protein
MTGMIRRWLATIQRQYVNPLDRRRAIGLTIMNSVVLVAALIGFLLIDILPLMRGGELGADDLIPFLMTPALVFFIQRFVLSGNIRFASWIFVALVIISTLIPRFDSINGTTTVIFIVPVVTAGILLDRRDFFAAIGALVFGIIVAAFNQSQITEPFTVIRSEVVLRDLSIVLLSVGISVSFLYIFSGTSEKIAEDMLENRGRLEMLQAARLGSASDENTVLVRAADLLMEKMLYTFSQMHLLDENGHLNTHVRTGMGTRHSVSRTSLPEQNAVYEAIRLKEAVYVNVFDALERRGHLLPSVVHAVALPLLVEDRVIGVLDVQSNQNQNPFHDNELMVLKLIAIELSDALIHARAQTQLQRALETQESTREHLQNQVSELRRQLEQSLGSDWTSYLRSRNQVAFGFDLAGRIPNLTPANDLPDHLKSAMLRGEAVIDQHGQEQIINVPIKRYNEVLGAMAFALPAGQHLTERQMEMANAVANRLAVALENARLVEQSQAQAARERKAGEISDQLLSQQEVRTLLDTAAHSFNEALGAIYTRIYLEPEALVNRSEEAV